MKGYMKKWLTGNYTIFGKFFKDDEELSEVEDGKEIIR